MLRTLLASLAGMLAALLVERAAAQGYPTRTVRIIVPIAAGGAGDVYSRALADELQKTWRHPVVVENRPGGSFNIGARACAEAAPDGHTLCVLPGEPIIYNQFQFKVLPYNPERDLRPIANLFFNTIAVVANRDLKVTAFAQLIALAKARRGLTYATFSFPMTAFMEKLKKAEGLDIVRVPYRGGGEVLNALLGGNTPIALLALSNMMPQLQGGQIAGLAVNSRSRSPLFPDLPTLAELRPGEQYPPGWFGLFTQSDVPRPIAEKVAADVARIIAEPGFRQRIYVERGIEPATDTLDDFARFIVAERQIARRIVAESGEPPR